MNRPVTIDPRLHDAVIFDLDGVVTDTASIHAAAWAAMFNEFLARRTASDDENHSPFTEDDYRHFVDGKPRHDGVVDFMASRGISLPVGRADRHHSKTRYAALVIASSSSFSNCSDAGVPVFDSTVALVRRLAEAGVATAIYSSSRNCEQILKAAGLGDLFAVRVDGVVADALGLPGKPDPAVLLEATSRLGAVPERSVVVEDAEAGVQAGRKRRVRSRHRRRPHRSRRRTPALRRRRGGARPRRCRRTHRRQTHVEPAECTGLLRPADRCCRRPPAVCVPRLRWHAVRDRLGSRCGHACRRRGSGPGEPGGAMPGGHIERP